uniref:WDR11 first beta-propeller domain-containing protein n=1 Tax=Fagus sylvatica TaxID=28930 RepID=A0A2N9EYD3_FAGSY
MLSPRPATPSTAVTVAQAAVQDSLDCMLPGPPSRNNFGSADLSPSGLLGFSAGSSVAILDTRYLQLITTLPLPPPIPLILSLHFITSVRWTPLPLSRDLLSTEPSSSHLLLAAADCQGRIALFDFLLQIPDPMVRDRLRFVQIEYPGYLLGPSMTRLVPPCFYQRCLHSLTLQHLHWMLLLQIRRRTKISLLSFGEG